MKMHKLDEGAIAVKDFIREGWDILERMPNYFRIGGHRIVLREAPIDALVGYYRYARRWGGMSLGKDFLDGLIRTKMFPINWKGKRIFFLGARRHKKGERYFYVAVGYDEGWKKEIVWFKTKITYNDCIIIIENDS